MCLRTQPTTSQIIHSIIPPVIYSIGILLNLLTLIVLHYKAAKSVMNWLLKMLCLWDLVYLGCLLTESFIDANDADVCSLMKTWENIDPTVYIDTIHYTAIYWIHVMALISHVVSVYQTTVVAAFRCIAIKWPFRSEQLLNYNTASVVTLVCLLLGIICHVPSFIVLTVLPDILVCYIKHYYDFAYSSDEYEQCLYNITQTQNNPWNILSPTTFQYSYHYYHIIAYSIILFLGLPFIILVLLNTVMLRELYSNSDILSHDDENKAVTKTVVAIVSVFLICFSVKPFYIVDIFYFGGQLMGTIALSSCGGYFTVSLIVIILPTLNSGVNFLLYFGFRKTFRDRFLSLVFSPSSNNQISINQP